MSTYIKYILVVLIITSNQRCQSGNYMNNINRIGQKIDIVNKRYSYILEDAKSVYLIGTEGRSSAPFDNTIVINYSIINSKSDWNSLIENVNGTCQSSCQFEDEIFIVSRQFSSRTSNPQFSSHRLYKVSKTTGEVVDLYQWNSGNAFIKDIYFENEEKGYVFYRPSGNPLDYELHSTKDGGITWSVYKINKPVKEVKYDLNSIYFLSYKRNDKTDWIFSIDKESKELDSLRFDLNITDFAVVKKGDYWLLGQDGDRTILQHYENGKATEIKTFSEDSNFFPNQLYKYNDVIVVLASKIDKSMLGGFGGTRPEMYFSKDNGLTWVNQSLGKVLYLDPVSFYKDERMTAYTGNGNVLTISFKY